MPQGSGFSDYARPNGPRYRLTGLPGPQHVQRRVLIAVENEPAARADVRAHGQALLYALATGATVLRRECRRDGFHSLAVKMLRI